MITLKEISNIYTETQYLFAIIFGLVFQYFLGDRRGMRIAIIMTASTIFVALFIAPAIIEALNMWFNIDPNGKIAISIYALSSIASVELLAILISIAPKAIGNKLKNVFGVRDVD